jgi:hypothetical protein
MTIPINSTLMKRHMLAYGYTYSNGGGTTEGQNRPIQVDANGVLQQGPTQSGGNVQGFIEVNSDDVSESQFAPIEAAFAYAWNPVSTGWDRNLSASTASDAIATNAQGGLEVIGLGYRWNGATFQRARGESVYHNALITGIGGTTAVWTPATKKFRLMGYSISVSGTLAAAATVLILLRDAAASTIQQLQVTVQATGTPGPDSQIQVQLGDGILSATATNPLNVVTNNVAAFVTGGIAVNVWGTEE